MTIGIIGGGNMGSAILEGIRSKYKVLVCEQDPARLRLLKKKYHAKIVDLPTLVAGSDVLLLAVKPQNFEEILSAIKPLISAKKLVVSIAAGISSQYIEKALGGKVRVIRTMPNLPAQIGMGMTALSAGRWASQNDLKQAQKIFDLIGQTVCVEEKWIDGITAVSGSGPAYVFLFLECFMKASASLGFDAKTSEQLIHQTIKGSLKLWEQRKVAPEILRAQVTSKGGTTQAAMDVFLGNKIDMIFVEALKAAKNRAKELNR